MAATYAHTLGLYVTPDTGCAAHPSCLSCPLPACLEDLPGRHPATVLRDLELLEDHAAGVRPPALADKYGISLRQVFRILSKGDAFAPLTKEPAHA